MTKLFKSATLWPAENLINHLITSDSHIKDRLKQFSGKTLTIQTTNPSFSVTAFIETEKISLSSADLEALNIAPDAAIMANASDLLSLLTDKDMLLPNSQIKIIGDIHLTQTLYTTIRSLDIQWADLLTPIAGDIVTNEINNFVHALATWRFETDKRVKRSIQDYLNEESKLAPNSTEIEKFSEELYELRLRIDRLNAKAELLHLKIDQVNN